MSDWQDQRSLEPQRLEGIVQNSLKPRSYCAVTGQLASQKERSPVVGGVHEQQPQDGIVEKEWETE